MKWETIGKMAAGIGTAILGLLGGWDNLVLVLIVAMAIDYISGLLVAALKRSKKTETGGISSKVGFAGLLKKGGILLVVVLAYHLDILLGDLGIAAAVTRTMVILVFIANEGISVIENVGLLGVPLPVQLVNVLEQLRGKAEKGETKT